MVGDSTPIRRIAVFRYWISHKGEGSFFGFYSAITVRFDSLRKSDGDPAPSGRLSIETEFSVGSFIHHSHASLVVVEDYEVALGVLFEEGFGFVVIVRVVEFEIHW